MRPMNTERPIDTDQNTTGVLFDKAKTPPLLTGIEIVSRGCVKQEKKI